MKVREGNAREKLPQERKKMKWTERWKIRIRRRRRRRRHSPQVIQRNATTTLRSSEHVQLLPCFL